MITLVPLIFFLISCSSKGYIITGNIDSTISTRQTGRLDNILKQNAVDAEYVLLIAYDGVAVLLTEQSIPYLNIVKQQGRFNSYSGNMLPPVCDLNDLREIYVYRTEYSLNEGHTPFSLRMQDLKYLGESAKSEHVVRKYQVKDKE